MMLKRIPNLPKAAPSYSGPLWTRTIPLFAVVVIFTAIGAVAGLLLAKNTLPGIGQPEGTVFHTAGFGGAPSSGEAARRAEIIIRGKVDQILGPTWNTADGRRPEMTGREIARSGYEIFTPFEINVEEVMKGSRPPNGKIVLRMAGGTEDGITFIAENNLTFHVGDDVIAFVRRCSDARVERLGSEAFRYQQITIWLVEGDHIINQGGYGHPLVQMQSDIEREKNNPPLYSPPSC